jgi:ABC-type proline/glycine betaine transport system substrate-binding protein
MGRMKEVYQAMKDDDWKGTPEEYLKWWLKKQAERIDKKNKKKKK